ncbi:FliH/SctL family protein [Thorsellia anophelis]|uniref:Flagellar assembly protein FliH n=1 Tax=Thorsellia anophelis DSM 18579 TaxID=1123402 RepID=A0A1H9ZTF1_9GAMM|nr:FliH/SctL family protein [Thorsellia anophelis]SES85048.1 Flagellar biosynthesis/type III secretory pathway protein FliH [Thorsellia anophelis DSM 18579]
MMTTSNHQSWKPWLPDNLASSNTNESVDYQVKRKELSNLRDKLITEKNQFEDYKKQSYELAKTEGFEEGKRSGFDIGYAEGFAKGQELGLEEARANQEALTLKLAEINDLFNNEMQHIKAIAPEKILQLALSAAKYLLQINSTILQEELAKKVQDELEKLPIAPKQLTLKINEYDWQFVTDSLKELFAQNNWKMLKDDELASGGFHIETDTQEIDATLEKRWEQIINLTRGGMSDA